MKIKFFCATYEAPTKAWYQQAICLAEGLKELNIDFFGNVNYWYNLEDKEFLIKENNVSDYDIAIYTHQYFEQGSPLKLVDPTKKNVLYDASDGIGFWHNIKQIPFDLILRTHYNKIYEQHYTKNILPWVFYLPKCVLAEIDKHENILNNDVYVNFRLAHGLRTEQYEKIKTQTPNNVFYKISESLDVKNSTDTNSYWCQTGRRFDHSYFEELSKHRFCFALGGELVNTGLYQYDSWRFWETMYSNSIPIHMDLIKYNCVLPFNPIKNEHYIGIDKDFNYNNLFKYSESVLDEISKNGKNFIKDNLNARNLTNYFLEKL